MGSGISRSRSTSRPVRNYETKTPTPQMKTNAPGPRDGRAESRQAKTENLTLPIITERVIRGDMTVDCPAEARVVRIFSSSTFTDTRHERNWLMEKVYPKLKSFCQNNGYEFQVVDMRWGIRDEAQDDHMTTDICLREVQLCKEQSTGPFFVSHDPHLSSVTISRDGSILYLCDTYRQTLYVVDTCTLEVITFYEDDERDTWGPIYHLSNDGRYIIYTSGCEVRLWDVTTGERTTILNDGTESDFIDVASPDMKKFISVHDDGSLKIWDKSRSEQAVSDPEASDGGREGDAKPGFFSPLDDTGRYFLTICAVAGAVTFAVCDSSTLDYICLGVWTCSAESKGVSYPRMAGDWKVSFVSNRRCHVLDLRSMKVVCIIQGLAPRRYGECFAVNNGKELATMTRGRFNIKLADSHTGKILSILKAGQRNRLVTIVTNSTGSRLAADCRGPILVFDVINRCVQMVIDAKMNRQLTLEDKALISPDGVYLFFPCMHEVGSGTRSVTSIVVTDISKRINERFLCDEVDYHTGRDINITGVHRLDNTRLVTAHRDDVVRIWNFTTGTLLKKLACSDCRFWSISSLLVTLSNEPWNTIRLWDTQTWECVTLYKHDKKIFRLQPLGPNASTLIGCLDPGSAPVLFNLRGPRGARYAPEDMSPAPALPLRLRGFMEIDNSHLDDETDDEDEDNPDTEADEENFDFHMYGR